MTDPVATTHDTPIAFYRAERKFDMGAPMTPEETAALVNGYRAEISVLKDRIAELQDADE